MCDALSNFPQEVQKGVVLKCIFFVPANHVYMFMWESRRYFCVVCERGCRVFGYTVRLDFLFGTLRVQSTLRIVGGGVSFRMVGSAKRGRRVFAGVVFD